MSFLPSILPCTVLSRKPFVFAAYDYDFLNRVPEFAKALPVTKPGPVLLLQLGWQCEKDRNADQLVRAVLAAKEKIPGIRIIILANSPKELESMKIRGMESIFCHQNAFLDERRYPVLPFLKKKFDALYIARITPFKRHYLAGSIHSLRLIGNFKQSERSYAESTLRQLEHAKWTVKYSSSLIFLPINRAACGLCLSGEEGAMFVCAEYLLCGIPVVNTWNIGGRDEIIPDFAMKRAEDSPASVAAAVRFWTANPPDPWKIRGATVAKFKEYRKVLLDLLESLGAHSAARKYRNHFPHKLELRSGRLADLWKIINGRAL